MAVVWALGAALLLVEVVRAASRGDVLMLTRGTRGDVQPMVALARGLAEYQGWHVTICTEDSFAIFVSMNTKNLSNGSVAFRSSGGDTMARMEMKGVQWAMRRSWSIMQTMIMSNVGVEFLESEPAMFAAAVELKPRYIIYGFTVTAIATIISESLQIPILGFHLQPTMLPSEVLDPVDPVSGSAMERFMLRRTTVAYVQSMTEMETLNELRINRGLSPLEKGRLPDSVLMEQGSPVVVPIDPVLFPRPSDWPASVVLSNLIYLPSAKGQLDPDLIRFLDMHPGVPIVAVTFSSHGISRQRIADSVIRIARLSTSRPRLVVCLGGQLGAHVSYRTKWALRRLADTGRVLEIAGAPFHLLFPRCHAAIVHGGLGTTTEAFRAGIPIIVTGNLLLDNRFWGRRSHELGVAPPMVRLKAFRKRVCAFYIDMVLRVDGPMAAAARRLADVIRPPLSDPNGILRNVRAVAALLVDARPISKESPSCCPLEADRQVPRPLQWMLKFAVRVIGLISPLFGVSPRT